MKVWLKRIAIGYAVAWVALMAVCHFISQNNPDLGMRVWNAGTSVLYLPWLILGKAIAAFFAMFSGTPGMIDDSAFDTVAIFALVIAFFVWGVPWMWKKLIGGGAKAAHH